MFDWQPWTDLLAAVVATDGKVDYDRLLERRARLEAVVAALDDVSPESDAARFPSDEHRLAYWLNAYNVFTLHAILAEYPITSVWKTRDGQFFQRQRHRRRRPRRQPRRHRARDPARRVPRAAHPLRHQLRLERLPGPAPVGIRRREPAGDPARRLGAVPRQRVELPHRPRGAARLRLAHLQDVRRGLRRRGRHHPGLSPRRAALRRPAHRRVARADRGLRGRLQHVRLGPERHQPPAAHRPDHVPRAGRALQSRRRRAARAPPLRGELLQPHVQLLHHQRLTGRVVPTVRSPRCSTRRCAASPPTAT